MTSDGASARDLVRYERDYGAHAFEAIQARMRKRMLLELLARLRPARVLEVGCGLDTLANHWRDAARFVVVEPSAAFASKAREQTRGRPDVEVIEAMLEDATADLAGGFDLVLISSLLHEVIDPGGLLDAARRATAKGGLTHVNVPNGRSFHRLLAMQMGLIETATELSAAQLALQQQRTFTADSLAAMAQAHGFEVADQGSYFIKPFTHGQMQALVDGGLMSEAMLEGLWGMTAHMPGLGSEIFVNLRPAA